MFYIIYLIFYILSKDYLKHISMKYFFSKDTTRCDYFIYSDYFEDGIKYLMYYITYNFINLYCSIFMISIITLSTFITSNLKIIYKEVKPSLKHPEFPSCTTFLLLVLHLQLLVMYFYFLVFFIKEFIKKNQ